MNGIQFAKTTIYSINADKPKVMTTVAILLNNNFQLVAPEKPITPSKNVIKDIPNTIFSGWVCSKIVKNTTVCLDDTAIKNNIIQTKENINDQRLILLFMLPLLN